MANSPNITERGTDGVAFEKPIPASQPGDVFPAGTVVDYAGGSAPSGWLICDGSVVSRATYPQLFANIGTAFGAGDGSTTFGIPDCRGRQPIGKHTSGTFQTMGQTGGEENHTLTVNEMPSHSHGGATGGRSAAHSHTYNAPYAQPQAAGGTDSGKVWGSAGTTVWIASSAASTNTETTDHTHAISAQGGGAAANNMAPYIVLNKIIRAY